MNTFDSVRHVLEALKAEPLIDDRFKRGLDMADRTHRDFDKIEKFWQPIETAPKDGTTVLLSGPYNDVSTAYWLDGEWHIQSDGMRAIENQSDFGTTYRTFDYPDFWMPVPRRPGRD